MMTKPKDLIICLSWPLMTGSTFLKYRVKKRFCGLCENIIFLKQSVVDTLKNHKTDLEFL